MSEIFITLSQNKREYYEYRKSNNRTQKRKRP